MRKILGISGDDEEHPASNRAGIIIRRVQAEQRGGKLTK